MAGLKKEEHRRILASLPPVLESEDFGDNCLLDQKWVYPKVHMFVCTVGFEENRMRVAQLIERYTHDQKATGSIPGRSCGENFFSRANSVWTLIQCLFQPCVTTVERKSHSAHSAGGRLHLSTHTPLTHWSRSGLTMLCRHSVGICQGNKLTQLCTPGSVHSG